MSLRRRWLWWSKQAKVEPYDELCWRLTELRVRRLGHGMKLCLVCLSGVAVRGSSKEHRQVQGSTGDRPSTSRQKQWQREVGGSRSPTVDQCRQLPGNNIIWCECESISKYCALPHAEKRCVDSRKAIPSVNLLFVNCCSVMFSSQRGGGGEIDMANVSSGLDEHARVGRRPFLLRRR